jgi:hypothetical protein
VKRPRSWAFAFTMALAGCGPAVDSMLFLSPAPGARPADHPIALYQEARPECPFLEIGTLSARKRGFWVSMEEVADGLRERARAMGGDAIIGVRMQTERVGDPDDGTAVIASHDRIVTGTVIRYRDPACTR